jgi:hypothetical protein
MWCLVLADTAVYCIFGLGPMRVSCVRTALRTFARWFHKAENVYRDAMLTIFCLGCDDTTTPLIVEQPLRASGLPLCVVQQRSVLPVRDDATKSPPLFPCLPAAAHAEMQQPVCISAQVNDVYGEPELRQDSTRSCACLLARCDIV